MMEKAMNYETNLEFICINISDSDKFTKSKL